MQGKFARLHLSPKKRSLIVDPLHLFDSLTLRGTVENIWEPQAEALKRWHSQRTQEDTVIDMNTGGGKTLIGHLVAQSLVNETRGLVLYVCPTVQLMEQAELRAAECSLEVATYARGAWTAEEVFREARGPCITNYAAVYNGKSIFRRESLAAVVFDDAHVAAPTIRSQFTIRLAPGTSAFDETVKLFRPYFDRHGHAQELDALLNGDRLPILFVPAFELNRHWQQLTHVLKENGVPEERETLFAWEHVRDRIDRCAVLIGAQAIEITPVSLPVSSVAHVASAGRRIYMTASLPTAAQFVRTFGVAQPLVVRPGGKSGDAQRLFVFAPGDTDADQTQWAKDLVLNRKACIITPAARGAQDWSDCASVYDGASGQAGLEQFKAAPSPTKLVLVARFDGIDLPGNSCRILVIHGLPTGSSLFDRFLDEGLGIESLRASATAVRVTQAIGRIFRSNTDHGVVVLVGRALQNWLRQPANQALLPLLLQRQIQLGMQLRDNVGRGAIDYGSLVDAILAGDRDWDDLYSTNIGEFETTVRSAAPAWLGDAAAKEHAAFASLWSGDDLRASRDLDSLASEVEKHDSRLGAWYRHWGGLAHERLGQKPTAVASYLAAANIRSELGRPTVNARTVLASSADVRPGPQAKRIAAMLGQKQRVTRMLESITAELVYGPATAAAEEALANLGRLLGLIVTRPDKEDKKGPDVLWREPESGSGAALEAKTDKKPPSQYSKDDVAQFYDHIKFLRDRYPKEQFFQAIIGRHVAVTQACSPPDDLRIIALEEFQRLTEHMKQMYDFVEASTDGDDIAVVVERWLRTLGLLWPSCFDALSYATAVQLQKPAPTVEQVQ